MQPSGSKKDHGNSPGFNQNYMMASFNPNIKDRSSMV